jgi:hypothetical protein
VLFKIHYKNIDIQFIGGKQGRWQVVDMRDIIGSSLELVERVNVVNDVGIEPAEKNLLDHCPFV